MPITEKQAQKRKKKIGSSDAAALLDCSPWGNAWDLWAEKTGKLEPEPANEAMGAGTILEDGVLDWASQDLGKIRRNQYRTHKESPLAANIDAIVQMQGLCHMPYEWSDTNPVEAKTVGIVGPIMGQWGEPGTDEVPDHVIIQCHVHMICLGDTDLCHVPVLFGGKGFQMFHVKLNQQLAGIIINRAITFFAKYVTPDIPPPNILPAPETMRRYRRTEGKTVSVSPAMVEAYREASVSCKIATEAKEAARTELLVAMGDAEYADAEYAGVATYKQRTRKGIDKGKLEADGLLKEYETETKSRTLLIKKPKKTKE